MSLTRRETLILRTGPPGSGKSHSAVMHLVDEWIPNHTGRVFTNLPLNLDAIAEFCAPDDDRKRQAILERIHLVPQEVEDKWLDDGANPADYFQQLEKEHRAAQADADPDSAQGSLFAGAMIIIDEAGKMWPSKDADPKRKENVANVGRWISTLRHDGARLVLLCQSAMQLAPRLRIGQLAAVELACVNCGPNRDPLTGVQLDHWLQLYAKFTGRYVAKIREEEYVAGGKEHSSQDYTYSRWLDPRYFHLYRSHNRRDGSNGAEEEQEWKRFGWLRFLMWLWQQNSTNLSVRLAALMVAWLLLAPPFSFLFKGFAYAAEVAPSILLKDFGLKKEPGASPPPAGASSAGSAPRTVLNSALKEELIEGANPVTMAEILSELETERARRTALEQQLTPQIVLIDEQGALTDEGDYIPNGESIPYGTLAALPLQSTDLRHDVATFDGPRVLRMRNRSAFSDAASSVATTARAYTGAGTIGTPPPSPAPSAEGLQDYLPRAGNQIR